MESNKVFFPGSSCFGFFSALFWFKVTQRKYNIAINLPITQIYPLGLLHMKERNPRKKYTFAAFATFTALQTPPDSPPSWQSHGVRWRGAVVVSAVVVSVPWAWFWGCCRMGISNYPGSPTTSWWLNQPIGKMCSSNWIISPRSGVKIKKKWNHHLEPPFLRSLRFTSTFKSGCRP